MGAPSSARNGPCELSEVCEVSIGCAELSQPETWRLLSQQTLLSERELGARVPKESVQSLVNEFVLKNLTVVLANLYLKHLLLVRNDVFKSWMSWLIAFMGDKKQLSEESLLGMNGTLRLNPNIVKQQQQKNPKHLFFWPFLYHVQCGESLLWLTLTPNDYSFFLISGLWRSFLDSRANIKLPGHL